VNNSGHAIITPSFRGDFDRCALLVESAARHVPESVAHYLVVDRRDVPMFRPLAVGRTRLVVVEDVIPWWIMRIPAVRRFWLSLRSRPLKNWILQQIVKLSAPRYAAEETLFFVDSDVFFVDRFEPSALLRHGKAPLFVEHGQRRVPSDNPWSAMNDRWHEAAVKLLGIDGEPKYDTNFIGNIICWRRSVAIGLLRHIEQITGAHWARAVARNWTLSEYVLYGVYATRVSKNAPSSQYPDATDRTHCYWENAPMSEADLERFRAAVAPPKVAAMISAKSRTDVRAIRKAFGY
jgi:hypothetical protein